MGKIKFSNDDIKAGYLVKTPGVYNYQIEKITEKPSGTDGTPNYTFRFKGLNGEMEGVVVFVMLSSKATWLLAPIFKAANNGELSSDSEYDVKDLEGCTVSAMTSRGTDNNGNLRNNLAGFAPAKE